MITLMWRRLGRVQQSAGFATAADIAQKTMQRFQKKYTDQTDSFEKRMYRLRVTQGGYRQALPRGPEASPVEGLPAPLRQRSTPTTIQHNPLTFSWGKILELGHDYIGPEQVSPHYENFMMSRKYAISNWHLTQPSGRGSS